MKKFLLLLFFISTVIYSQTKYYIYFTDKGIVENNRLNKSSMLYKAAEKELTQDAIERRKLVMGEDYITYDDIPINQNYIDQLTQLGIKIENKLKWFNAVTSYLTNQEYTIIKNLTFVKSMERVGIIEIVKPIENTPKDDSENLRKTGSVTGLNYGLSATQNNLSDIPYVHDLGITGQGVKVGMLDSGFRWKSHPSLKNLKISSERDFVQKDDVTENQFGDASSQDSHGTACLSLMAGYDPGYLIGPAFGATIILAKTENVSSETHAEEDNYAAALEWMESQGVQITTSSLGYANDFTEGADYTFANMDGKTTIVAKAVTKAYNLGVSVFTAAGNERGKPWNHIVSPGDEANAVTVGAVNSSNILAGFSSPGPSSDGRIKPEVVAMGVSNFVALTGGTYSNGSGTSYATPIAAGVAALLKSTWPHLTNQQIRDIFIATGDKYSSPNNDYGYGLVSAKRIVSFPNLKRESDGKFTINKLFADNNGVNSSTVNVIYKIGNGTFQTAKMNYDGLLKYNYTLPTFNNNEQIDFYFTYNNNSGTSVKEPSGAVYKLSYGSLTVSKITGVEDEFEIPTEFELSQNYPNPFNPSTVIKYKVQKSSYVTLKVYDMLGREVETLVDKNLLPGNYTAIFKLSSSLSSGVYFYTLRAGDFEETKKMILMK